MTMDEKVQEIKGDLDSEEDFSEEEFSFLDD